MDLTPAFLIKHQLEAEALLDSKKRRVEDKSGGRHSPSYRHRHGGESPRASSHYVSRSERRGNDQGTRERRGNDQGRRGWYKEKHRSRRSRSRSSHSSFEDDFGVRKETMLHGSYEDYLKEYNTSKSRPGQEQLDPKTYSQQLRTPIMRFNEKELALFAASFEPDREGLLEKKGATKGQGYKARWFRLKGNLLFYYKVDESGGWESSAPVGVIVLEGCAVKTVNIDSRPYTFSLEFQNDDARTYILVASSQSELDGWVEVLKAASYESLREMKAALQKQLSELTGTSEDVGDIGHHSKKSNFKKQSLSVSVNEAPCTQTSSELGIPRTHFNIILTHLHNSHFHTFILTHLHNSHFHTFILTHLHNSHFHREHSACVSTVLQEETSGQYTISLKCTHLTVGKDQLPPSTIMAVQCFDCHQKQLLANISRTEVVKTSCEPLYTHTPLLTIGPTCPENGFLKFEVFAMHKAPQVLASSGSEEGSSPGEFDSEEEEGVCQLQAMPESIGMAWCSIRDVMKASNGDRSIVHKLNHVSRDRNLRSGVLHITVTKLEETNSTHEAEVINTATSPGVLQSIMKSPTRSCFSFPQLNSPPNRVRVIEEKAASVFNILVPIELLKCYMKEDQQQIDVLNDIGPLNEIWTDRLQEYQAIHYESLAHYHQKVQELENLADAALLL
eukprot:Em0011g986a